MTREECCAVVAEKDMPRTVYDMIVAMQEKYAERPAFRWVDDATKTVQEKTYGQFVEDIRKMTSYLQANVADVKGQRIVILSRTNYEYGVVTFGAVMAGAVIVTLNQKKTWPELEYELGLSEPALIFTDGIDYGYADELKAAYGDKLRPMNAYEGSAPAELANRIDPNALMMLMFTSGTTGRSKGVMLSEKNYFSAVRMYVAGQVAVMRKAQELAPKDMDKPFSHFTLVPMFHLSGFICYFAYGIHGWTLNLCADPRDVRRDMSMMHSDAMSTPPVLVEMIYNEIRRGNQDKLNGLWNLSCSSAILDPEILSYLIAHGFYINQCYSMTELAGYGLLNIAQEGEHLRALGKPDGFCEIKLDETGEICVRGDVVMLGYYKNEEATAEVVDKDGWLHTGDLGLMDAEGNVTIKGRSKNMLLGPNGQNIYPEEIEDKLNNLPYVAESIIVQQNEKLVGLVYPDFDDAFAHGLNNDDIERVMEENRVALNAELPAYSQISKMKIYPEEFEKTPKKSIKRFLYQEAKGL